MRQWQIDAARLTATAGAICSRCRTAKGTQRVVLRNGMPQWRCAECSGKVKPKTGKGEK